MKKLIIGFASVLMLSLPMSAFSAAEEVAEPQEKNEYNHNPATKAQKEIELIVIQADLEARDEAYKELTSLNKGLNNADVESTQEYQDIVQEKIDKKIEKHDIKRVIDDPEFSITPMAGIPSTEVTVNRPTVYSSSQGYFIKASIAWKRNSYNEPYWQKHRPSLGSAMGGEDGLGIYFGDPKNIEINSSSFYTADNFNKVYNQNISPSVSQPRGVYYKSQDHMYASYAYEYTYDKAYITVWPYYKGRVNTMARTHFTHTWSSAKITGVGISSSGFSISISNTGYSYDGVSTTGTPITY